MSWHASDSWRSAQIQLGIARSCLAGYDHFQSQLPSSDEHPFTLLHDVYSSRVMSSPVSGRSVDKIESPFSTSAYNHDSLPQNSQIQSSEFTRRHGRSRGSTASSITSIGGVLDTTIQERDTMAEASNNGEPSSLNMSY